MEIRVPEPLHVSARRKGTAFDDDGDLQQLYVLQCQSPALDAANMPFRIASPGKALLLLLRCLSTERTGERTGALLYWERKAESHPRGVVQGTDSTVRPTTVRNPWLARLGVTVITGGTRGRDHKIMMRPKAGLVTLWKALPSAHVKLSGGAQIIYNQSTVLSVAT